MAADHFQNQMNWVQSLSGDEQLKAGSVVAWQCIATTLDELVRTFNTITFGSDNQKLKRNR